MEATNALITSETVEQAIQVQAKNAVLVNALPTQPVDPIVAPATNKNQTTKTSRMAKA